jgi:hypothetical protein
MYRPQHMLPELIILKQEYCSMVNPIDAIKGEFGWDRPSDDLSRSVWIDAAEIEFSGCKQLLNAIGHFITLPRNRDS